MVMIRVRLGVSGDPGSRISRPQMVLKVAQNIPLAFVLARGAACVYVRIQCRAGRA